MNITTLFVTHDQEEAFDLADRVVIMNAGTICQEGAPIEIYQTPANIFVHEFLGESNKLPVTVRDGIVYDDAGAAIGAAARPDGVATAYIRPHHIAITASPHGAWRIARIAATGAQARISLVRGATTLEAAMTADALLESGLAADNTANIQFTGGMLFSEDGANPVKLTAPKPALAPISV
jgi:sulfate transport system ATP-binding protein